MLDRKLKLKIFKAIVLSILCVVGNLLNFPLIEPALAANYKLGIINIGNVGSINRINFAYTGLKYNIRVAAKGGVFPYTYSLVSAPTGMTINPNTGEITWRSPTDGSHNCTVRVIDSELNTDTNSWTITVSTDSNKFHFVDSVNGKTRANGGTGTIDNPWKDVSDFYLSETDNTYAGDIIYFRAGTYTLFHPEGSSRNERGIGSDRIVFNNNHPNVYLAYPGESVTINLEGYGSTGKNFFINASNNYYFYGLKFDNIWNYGIEIYNSKYLTVYKCTFDNYSTYISASNQACISYAGSESQSNYNVIQNNIFQNGIKNATGVETYGVYYSVIEDNTITNLANYGIFIKTNSSNNVIRNNKISNCNTGLNTMGYGNGCNDNEFCFNLVNNVTGQWAMVLNSAGKLNTIYIYRNTLVGPAAKDNYKNSIYFRGLKETDGIINIYNNVLVGNNDDSGNIGTGVFYRHKFLFNYLESANVYNNRIVFTNNLEGSNSGSIVDANGNLTSSYSQYLGYRGYQVLNTPPEPPKGLMIIR